MPNEPIFPGNSILIRELLSAGRTHAGHRRASREFHQAATADKQITGLPDMVQAAASPLANADQITPCGRPRDTSLATLRENHRSQKRPSWTRSRYHLRRQ
jgi:hypothetical protein